MTFTITKERLTAVSSDGAAMGHITFPQVKAGLVNIERVVISPQFRNQGVGDAMMEALLSHLTQQNRKAVLTCPFAQQYLETHSQWKHVLPGHIHFTTH